MPKITSMPRTPTYPTLYKQDQRGATRVWKISVAGDSYITEHGVRGEALIFSDPHVCKPKNIGRANETTAFEQAIAEAWSRWNKQKDKGYTEDPNGVVQVKNPMLAHDYNKQGHRIKYPCDIQPKLDGVRCLILVDPDTRAVTFKTRGNKTYPLIPEIVSEILFLHDATRLNEFDGELYVHRMALQDIQSAVKKHNENTPRVKFVVFDLPLEMKWPTRLDYLTTIDSTYRNNLKRVMVIDTYTVASEQKAMEAHKHYVQQGYEGIMLRNHNGVYKYTARSADLQKFKTFVDDDFEIVSCHGDQLGEAIFLCKTKEGKEFKAKIEGDHATRVSYVGKDYSGKHLTVRYQALTKDGIPQFPIGVVVCDPK